MSFGSMQFIMGQAFSFSTDDPNQISPFNPNKMRVASEWSTVNGMNFMIESVPYSQLIPKLGGLPKSTVRNPVKRPKGALDVKTVATRSSETPIKSAQNQFAVNRQKPSSSGLIAGFSQSPGKMSASNKSPIEEGFILDYILVSAATSYEFYGNVTYYVTGDTYLSGTTVFDGGAVIKYAPYTGTPGVPRLFLFSPAICNTSMYRPVICTASDDNSSGESISGSSGSPSGYYGYSAIHFYNISSPIYLHDVHFRYSHLGFAGEATASIEGRHLQFYSCYWGPAIYSGTMTLGNVLVSSGTYGLQADVGTLTGENITVASCNTVLHSQATNGVFNLTNSLWVANSSFGSDYGTFNEGYNTTDPYPSFDNEQVQGGNWYLKAGSARRGVGTANIRSALAADLRLRTTYAPVVISSDFGINQTLSPVVARDSGTNPDQGYHYDLIDYAISGRSIAGGTLILTNGVRIGFYGTNGIFVSDPVNLISQGGPTNLNRFVQLQAVQEQPPSAVAAFSMLSVNGSSATSLIKLRFTEVDMLADTSTRAMLVNNGSYAINNLTIQDSELHNAALILQQSSSSGMTAALTNNLIDHGYFVLNRVAGNGLTVYGRNNLFRGGTLDLTYMTSGSNPGWEWRDNLFETVTLSGGGSYVTNSNNGYYSTTSLPNSAGSNVTLTSVDYQAGPLGPYYYPQSGGSLSALVDAGSRSASAAGLYHYTTYTYPGQKKLTSTVDIGHHYVVVINPLEASQGYSGVQGANGWYYQYAAALGLPASYLPIYDPDPVHRWWEGTGDYTLVWNNAQLPGSVYDSVRTLVVPSSGEITITRSATAWDATTDGVRVRVLKNSSALLDWVTLPSYLSGTNLNLVTTVTQGDQLHFQVNRVSDNARDTVGWNPLITYSSFPASSFYVLPDYNGNGVPDFLEDANGNGVVDSGETDWQSPNDSGLKVRITQPRIGAIIP